MSGVREGLLRGGEELIEVRGTQCHHPLFPGSSTCFSQVVLAELLQLFLKNAVYYHCSDFKFSSEVLLAVTLIKCQLKCADGLCVSIHAWQIRTLAGFVPWAAQLGFSMSSSACHDLGKRSFIPKNLNKKRLNSLFFISQYIATE